MLNNNPRKVVAGIGSALVDILAYEDDDFLEKTGAAKGGMMLVDRPFIDRTLAMSNAETVVVPGGSACNTVVGVAKLGGSGRFIGKCGEDDLAALFEEDLIKNGVEPDLFKSGSPTGRVLSIITPDAQRSMFTFLGASSEMTIDEIAARQLSDVAIVHIEGYLLFNKDLIYAALECAKAAGAMVSLDLASYTVVESSREVLEEIVERYVDILIGNEDEVRAFTGQRDENRAITALARKAEIAVLKVGERGSFIAGHDRIVKIEPVTGPAGNVIDTTGAGDLWASGFLYGLVKGYSLETCGRIGSACGYEVCRVVGANIPEEGWARIRAIAQGWPGR